MVLNPSCPLEPPGECLACPHSTLDLLFYVFIYLFYFVLINSSVSHPKQKSASHPDPCKYTHTHTHTHTRTHTPQFSGSLRILSHEILLTCLLASSFPLVPSCHYLVQTHPPLTWTTKIVSSQSLYPSSTCHWRNHSKRSIWPYLSVLKIFLVFTIAFRMKNKLQPNIRYLLWSGPCLLQKPHPSSIPSLS